MFQIGVYTKIILEFSLLIVFVVSMSVYKNGVSHEILNDIFVFVGGQYFMSSITTGVLTKMKKLLELYKPDNKNKKESVISKKYEFEALLKKSDNVSQETQRHYDEAIRKLDNAIERELSDGYYEKDEVEKYYSCVKNILEASAKQKVLENVRDVVYNVEKYISNFTDNKDTLKKCVIKPFVYNLASQGHKTRINAIYLHGSPGVGKTRFVENFAKITNAYVSKLTITQIGRMLDGYMCYQNSHHNFSEDKLNPITLAVRNSKINGFCGTIVMIDEMDKFEKRDKRVLFRFLLQALNSESTTFYDEYLDFNVDLNNVLFVCAGNKKIEELGEEAIPLKSRFIEILFGGIETVSKEKIVREYIHNKVKEKSIRITKEINKYIGTFITGILKTYEATPGVREILNQTDVFICELLSKEVFMGTVWEERIDIDFLVKPKEVNPEKCVERGSEESEDEEDNEE